MRIYLWLCNSYKGYGGIIWEEGFGIRRKKKGIGMVLEGVFLFFFFVGNFFVFDMDSFYFFEFVLINDSKCR